MEVIGAYDRLCCRVQRASIDDGMSASRLSVKSVAGFDEFLNTPTKTDKVFILRWFPDFSGLSDAEVGKQWHVEYPRHFNSNRSVHGIQTRD